MLLLVGGDLRLGLLEHRAGQFRRQQRVGQLIIAGIRRQRLGEIDMVAVQIHAFLGDAAQPGEAMRVDRMDVQRGDTFRQGQRAAGTQPVDLPARAGEAFHAMRAGNGDQHLLRVLRAEPGGVRRQLLAQRPAIGIHIGLRLHAIGAAAVAELLARLGIVGGEAVADGGQDIHGDLLDRAIGKDRLACARDAMRARARQRASDAPGARPLPARDA